MHLFFLSRAPLGQSGNLFLLICPNQCWSEHTVFYSLCGTVLPFANGLHQTWWSQWLVQPPATKEYIRTGPIGGVWTQNPEDWKLKPDHSVSGTTQAHCIQHHNSLQLMMKDSCWWTLLAIMPKKMCANSSMTKPHGFSALQVLNYEDIHLFYHFGWIPPRVAITTQKDSTQVFINRESDAPTQNKSNNLNSAPKGGRPPLRSQSISMGKQLHPHTLTPTPRKQNLSDQVALRELE